MPEIKTAVFFPLYKHLEVLSSAIASLSLKAFGFFTAVDVWITPIDFSGARSGFYSSEPLQEKDKMLFNEMIVTFLIEHK